MTCKGKRGAAALLVGLAWGCAGEPGEQSAAGGGDFCRVALARVESFMGSFGGALGARAADRYGGTAVVASIGELADGMNALVSSDNGATQHQTFVNLMTLLRYDDSYQPVPYLAESWEVDDAESPTEITWHLRDDVYWHDGERTDAYDVRFTWLRVTDPLTAFPNAAYWDHYVKGAEGVEVVDSFTVKIKLRPHADYLDPWRQTAIMPEHLLGDVPPTELRQHPFGTQCPVGNGPFVFVSHRPQESWTFRANPAFPEALGGRPYLDRYVYRVVPEQTTLLTDLLTESVDVYIAPRPDQARAIMDSPDLEFRRFPFREFRFVAWNTRRPQLADARVRRAITLGTNRREIVEALLAGYGTIANSTVPPFHWANDESLMGELPYDPGEARRLLDEAGWIDRDGDGVREGADGTRLSFTIKYNQGNQQRQDIAEIMQAQLTQLGMEVRPQVVEWTTLLEQINTPARREFDGVVMAWVTDFKVDDSDLFHSERLDAPYQWTGTQNPEIDRLLDTLQLVVDRDRARPLWQEYQRAVMEEQPFTIFFFPERLAGINRRLEDVRMDARGEWVNLKDWWIAADERRASGGAAAP
jgi:peptide/nickel transport system substrate-binding protein